MHLLSAYLDKHQQFTANVVAVIASSKRLSGNS